MRKKWAIGFLALIGSCFVSRVWASGPSPDATTIAQVWAREEAYWRFVQAGDVDRYLDLWHDRFVGWPCTPHTATKASIADWVRAIRDEKVRITYTLTREGAQEVGVVVVTYYLMHLVREYPNGGKKRRDDTYRFTHTWLKVGESWRIIGGMCGLEQPAP